MLRFLRPKKEINPPKKELQKLFLFLSILLNAKLSLQKSLEIIKVEIKEIDWFIEKILYLLQKGITMDHAFVDSTTKILIDAGYKTGKLDSTFKTLAALYEFQENSKKKLFEVIAYPFFVFACLTLLLFGVSNFFIPSIATLLDEKPESFETFALIFSYLPFLIVGASCFYFLLRFLNILPKEKFFKLYENMIFLMIFSQMIDEKIDIKTALDSQNIKVSLDIGVCNAFESLNRFSSITIQLIKIGESSGELANLLKIAQKIEQSSFEDIVKKYIALTGPVMTLIIGCILMSIIIMIIFPLYEQLGQG